MSRRIALPVLLAAALVARADADPLVRLGSERLRQVGQVRAIAYSPDGSRLATAGDKAVYIWDATDGRRLQTLATDRTPIDLAFTDGGKVVSVVADAGATRTTELIRIDAATGKLISQQRVFDGQCNGHMSPDGKWFVLLACEIARGFALVDTTTGKIAWQQPNADDHGHCADAFRADGREMAVGMVKGRVQLRDPATGEVLHDYRLPRGVVVGMAYAPDGNDLVIEIYSETGRHLARIAARTGEERWSVPIQLAEGLAFTPDGRALRYRERWNDRLLWQWLDAGTGKSLDRTMTTDFGKAFALRADGRMLTVGAYEGFISQWDLEARRRLEARSADPPESVTELRFNADGSKLRGFSRGWYEWDLKTGKQTRLAPDIDRWMTRDIAVSDDQRWLARVVDQQDGNPGRLEIVDLRTDRMKPAELRPAHFDVVRFAADGRLLVTDESGIRAIDSATGKPTVEIPWDKNDRPVAITEGGTLALTVAPMADRLQVLRRDLSTGKTTGAWENAYQNPFGFTTGILWRTHLSPDGDVLGVSFHLAYLGDPEGHVILYDARTGRRLHQWRNQQVQSCWAFGRDSRSIVLHPSRSGVEVREVATGGRRTAILENDRRLVWTISSAAVSPDGRTIVFAHEPGPLGLWDLVGQPTGPWADEKADRLWADLASADAEVAFGAMRHLRQHPAEATAFLRRRVTVPAAPRPDWIADRIKALDAGLFRDREKATADLAGAGELVLPELRAAIKAASPEAARRIEGLVDKAAGPTPDKWRASRVCEVLEGIGSPEVRELMAAWAKGPAEATLTREAAGSVGRLKAR